MIDEPAALAQRGERVEARLVLFCHVLFFLCLRQRLDCRPAQGRIFYQISDGVSIPAKLFLGFIRFTALQTDKICYNLRRHPEGFMEAKEV